MASVWQRANTAIAARAGLLALLACVPLLPEATTPVDDIAEAVETGSPAISIDTATQTARPGEQVSITVATYLVGEEAVLLVNGIDIARQRISESGRAKFELGIPALGPLVIGAEIVDAATQASLASAAEGAAINVTSPPTIAVLANRQSTYADSLRRGGWSVAELTPANISDQSAVFPSLLVLDDVAANDLPENAWQAIDEAVRTRAMGLLVLGGPSSFGLGAYRGSRLETMLPVVSEPPQHEPPASVMFLVDVSGSMDQPVAETNRLQVARQAVVATSQALRPIDRVGLMSFEVDVVDRLPLTSRPDHAVAVETAWPDSASGGTRLAPALARAVQVLEQEAAEHRLLVVLTDGNVDDEDLVQLESILETTDIDVVGLILGAASGDDDLARLIRATGGQARAITDILHLPEIMRSEVEDSRPAIVRGPSEVNVLLPTPWLPDAAWAPVDNYMLTRPTQDARIHLASNIGDVILASRQHGAGRVAALTPGISNWTEAWLTSEQWPVFITGLTSHLAVRDDGNIEVSFAGAGRRLVVDISESIPLRKTTARLVAPSGETTLIDLEPAAPRRLAAQMDLPEAGLYVAVIESESAVTRHHFVYKEPPDSENPMHVGPETAALAGPHALLAIVLLGFLLVMWWERR